MFVDTNSEQIGELTVLNPDAEVATSLKKIQDAKGLTVFQLEMSSAEALYPQPITVQWKIPALNVMGVWKPTSDFSKRIQADWELEHMESRISIDAPVINLFGFDDSNILTFACSNAINKLEMNACLREEDNCFYCHITFFSECAYPMKNFKAQLYLDYRKMHFAEALKEVSKWWETFPELQPAYVPPIAKLPLYSSWYQFHQNLDLELLMNECKIAADLGYKAVVIDDGWQTVDSNRGYDFTGDWQPERIPDMASYVAKIHDFGMKVALWYSVPFCGKRSKAYSKFKGKFLTENHRWAPVFDPRFPEVREYLISIYVNALRDWKLDGFKLDFIDDFRLYPDTPLNMEGGRDYASINKAVDRLLTDVMTTLQAINPEVFIEFRQKYTGPAMRKYGNMFRAFDCPGDATMNRVRIADIKMLCGNTAVHSDMVTWHPEESLEIAALQMTNTLFGVPQLSVMLQEIPEDHMEMIAFYTAYWNRHAHILMEGNFTAVRPLANYPMKKVIKNDHVIIGVYDTYVVPIDGAYREIHLLNSQLSSGIVLHCISDLGAYKAVIFNCRGNEVTTIQMTLSEGAVMIQVPACGMVQLTRSQ